jgi:hypothetical protein
VTIGPRAPVSIDLSASIFADSGITYRVARTLRQLQAIMSKCRVAVRFIADANGDVRECPIVRAHKDAAGVYFTVAVYDRKRAIRGRRWSYDRSVRNGRARYLMRDGHWVS